MRHQHHHQSTQLVPFLKIGIVFLKIVTRSDVPTMFHFKNSAPCGIQKAGLRLVQCIGLASGKAIPLGYDCRDGVEASEKLIQDYFLEMALV